LSRFSAAMCFGAVALGVDTVKKAVPLEGARSDEAAEGTHISWLDYRAECPLTIRYLVAQRLKAKVQACKRHCSTRLSMAKYCDALAGAENLVATALIKIVRDMRRCGVSSISLPPPFGQRTATQLSKEAVHARSVAFQHRTESCAFNDCRRKCPAELQSIAAAQSKACAFAIPARAEREPRSFAPGLASIVECQPEADFGHHVSERAHGPVASSLRF